MPYVIDDLLKKAYHNRASDLHLTVGSPPMFRINGKLFPAEETPVTGQNMEQMAKKILKDENWDGFIETGEIDFSYSLKGVSRYRVNAYFQRKQIGIAARVIPNAIPTIESLNMPSVLHDLMEKPQGLILITGPTGSGKSTTLASMIDYMNQTKARHIITLEDPIEYEHQHKRSIINQREIGPDTESFERGLRAALRQDPDIILVGEMRDFETISTAITAAETGHLVLATLHTSSAAETINRIIDVFPPYQQQQVRIQLSHVLEGIVSQRLLLKRDRKGRIAATEVLINLPSIANLIRNEKVDQIRNILQTSRQQGMHTLEMSINELLEKKIIRYEDVKGFLTNGGEY
jgi:twitching motility protein PilT